MNLPSNRNRVLRGGWQRGKCGIQVVFDGLVLRDTASGVNLQSGKLEWEQTFRATGRPFCHPTSANAAPSPASDGQRIFAFFSSNDLACLSLSGELLWYRGLGYDYPKAGNDVGMASSPVVVDGTVIVKVEAQGDSFAAAIDAETGKNLWRIERPQMSNWASPLVIRVSCNTCWPGRCKVNFGVAGSERW